LYCMNAIKQLRASGITAELYPSAAKMKKQMNYANKRKFPYVILVGSEEMDNNVFTVKKMSDGTQQKINLEGLIQLV